MKMTHKIVSVLAVAAMGCALLSQKAQANPIPISGTIQIGGIALLDNPVLNSANNVLSVLTSAVAGGTGDYTGTAGAPVTWGVPFGWNPPLLPPPGTPPSMLWQFTSGVTTYEFDLSSIAKVGNNPLFLDITGTGVADISGYLPTPGTWSFTITSSTGTSSTSPLALFQFSSSDNAIGIPDGGMTIALLGLALTGIGALRMKQAK